ncbi:MAG: hypothetical protein WEC33_01615 [Dehalococcoidia bacterium]
MGRLLCLVGSHHWTTWGQVMAVPFKRRECERCGLLDVDHRAY